MSHCESRLEQALFVLFPWRGIPGDTAADAALGIATSFIDNYRTDRHIKPGSARWRDIPDGARIHLSRRTLDLGNDLHGLAFGSASDRGAGEQRFDDFGKSSVGGSLHRRCHL